MASVNGSTVTDSITTTATLLQRFLPFLFSFFLSFLPFYYYFFKILFVCLLVLSFFFIIFLS